MHGKKHSLPIVLIACVGVLCALGFFSTPCNAQSGYAYGENVGWINLNPSYGPGLTVTSTEVTGHVWAENIGWINFSPNEGGVKRGSGNNLFGYAWAENAGWISFSCSNTGTCDSANYGVKYHPGSGSFSGYAWGENIGWIKFLYNGSKGFLPSIYLLLDE